MHMRIVLPKSFRNIIVCAVLMTVQFLAPHVVCATEIVIPQTRQITGRVTGVNSKEGIPGVSVYEKGTTTGTLTDAEGKYSLSVSDNAIVVFSSIGFRTEEVSVGNQQVIDVALTEDITSLEEVVVVGY